MSEITHSLRSALIQAEANVATLSGKISALQDQLKSETGKVDHLRGLLTIYEAEEREPQPSEQQSPDALGADEEDERKPATKKTQMEQEIVAVLTLRGKVHRNDLLRSLLDKKIMGGEKSPIAHLAAYLSANRDKFESDGRGNFRLRRKKNTGPPPAPAGAGSADGRNPGSNPGLPSGMQH